MARGKNVFYIASADMMKKPICRYDQTQTESVAIEISANIHRIAHHSQTSIVFPQESADTQVSTTNTNKSFKNVV